MVTLVRGGTQGLDGSEGGGGTCVRGADNSFFFVSYFEVTPCSSSSSRNPHFLSKLGFHTRGD